MISAPTGLNQNIFKRVNAIAGGEKGLSDVAGHTGHVGWLLFRGC